MIHAIMLALRDKLAAQNCPIPVIDGPETTDTSTWSRERIVVEHGDGDKFVPPPTPQKNPRPRMVRMTAGKITIYAQSPNAGALYFEHRERAEQVLDLVVVALARIYSENKAGGLLLPDSGRFIDPPDLDQSMSRGGAVYELHFTFPRAVFETTWKGDPQPEAEVGADFDINAQGTRRVGVHGSNTFENF